jgi:(R,R)-butanediol dehydrogenase/meso-butanediol dehydrogenase/diacetyl reductase
MKAAVYKEPKKLVIEDVPAPIAGADEVIVKVKNVGICGSDLHFSAYGLVPPDTIMGHEVTGTIVSVGSEVKKWKEGDRMLLYFVAPCGKCPACGRGDTHLCWEGTIVGGGTLPGGFAEYLKVLPEMVIPLAPDANMRDASLADPVASSYRAVLLSGIKPGDTALVMGAGPIGLCLLQHLKSAGIEQVVVSEPVARRGELAAELGADTLLNPAKDDIDSECKKLTDGAGPDFVFDCVGIPDTVMEAAALVRISGKVVWVGVCMESTTITPVMWMLKEISIQTSLGFTKSQMEYCLELILERKINADRLISEVISLDEVPHAFERLQKPNTEVKIIVEF